MKTLLALACLTVPAYAGNCHVVQRQVVNVAAGANTLVTTQGFIAVPFAVPVAVPSYVQYQAVPAPAAEGMKFSIENPKTGEVLKPGVAQRMAEDDPNRPPKLTLVAQSCLKCHSGDQAKKGFRVDQPLSAAQRLHAIQRILSDDPAKRMPKGKELDSQAIGLLIQELSKSP